MHGPSPSNPDSQSASRHTRSESSGDSNGGNRLLALTGLSVTVLSIALSGLGYGILPGEIRIHWTLGLGPYYGPEFAPTLAVLAGFSLVILGTALGAYWLDDHLRQTEEFTKIRPYYTAVMMGVLGMLLAFQGTLILANL